MHVLLIQDQLRIGGTERQTLFLARYLRETGHEASLLVFRPGGHLADSPATQDIPIHTLQRKDTKLALYAPGLFRTVEKLKPDCVLCMGRTANCYAGWLQRRFPNVPVVSTVRTGKLLFPLHLWSLHHTRAVLVNSSWWKRRLLKDGLTDDRILVVRNSVLLDAAFDRQSARTELRAKEHIPDECPVFLNIATFRPGKRHADLLRLFAKWREQAPDRDWRLWLVGDGQEFHKCKRLKRQLGLADRVKLWGYQKSPQSFYAAADIAVSASLEDSLPNFLIEAQAMRLPLVAWHYRGVAECCLPDESGFILPAGNNPAFIERLTRLAVSPKLRHEMGSLGESVARERFSAEAQAARTVRFLERLVKK